MKESDLEKERTVMMKACTKCGETKPPTEFYKREKTCRTCVTARRAELDAMSPQQRSIARLKAIEKQKQISAAILAGREATA